MRLNKLTKTFNELFAEKQPNNPTLLIGNAKEPIYIPRSSSSSYNKIYFREDFISSALHEISHWTIAGPKRLLQTDYGYWYLPERGSPGLQKSFLDIEVKPQALEWLLSSAMGIPFFVSLYGSFAVYHFTYRKSDLS